MNCLPRCYSSELFASHISQLTGEGGHSNSVAHNCLHLAIVGVSKSCRCPLLLARDDLAPTFPSRREMWATRRKTISVNADLSVPGEDVPSG